MASTASPPHLSQPPHHEQAAYPVQLTGEFDPQLSRGLWLVKARHG